MADRLTVLVVGASRGLGLALAAEFCERGWQVIATQRDTSDELAALSARYPQNLQLETVDIADAASVRVLRERLSGRRLDTLFVNAGVCIARDNTPIDVAEADFTQMMLTNALSPMRVVEMFEDLVPADGVVVVMSSELGSIENNRGFWELYSASKAALNMLMKCFAKRHDGDPRAFLLMAPGWVRTEMGGDAATLSIEESIPHVVTTVERSRGKAGLRFVDRHGGKLPW